MEHVKSENSATLSAELLGEFKRLCHEEFGEELSESEVLATALAFLDLMAAIYRPIPIHKAAVYKALERCYGDDAK